MQKLCRGVYFPFVSKIVCRDHVHMESAAPGPNLIVIAFYICHYYTVYTLKQKQIF